jgi:ABC-type multidrug transport system ATPase subunit
LQEAWNRPFSTLSGGQQARFQILVLELSGATLLLLDEPTDNLDLASAEALEAALAQYAGTVLVVTHDRWLMRSCDRYLLFGRDCSVRESDELLQLIRPHPSADRGVSASSVLERSHLVVSPVTFGDQRPAATRDRDAAAPAALRAPYEHDRHDATGRSPGPHRDRRNRA